MLAKILLIQLFVNAWVIRGAVWNHVSKDCSTCYCPDTKRSVCTIIKENKKAPPIYKTFQNDCEYVCYAACNEEKVKFVYCGECDNRTLPSRGSKGVPQEMIACLNFTIIPGEGIGGSYPVTTTSPPKNVAAEDQAPTALPDETATLDHTLENSNSDVLPPGSIVLGYKPELTRNGISEEESCSEER